MVEEGKREKEKEKKKTEEKEKKETVKVNKLSPIPVAGMTPSDIPLPGKMKWVAVEAQDSSDSEQEGGASQIPLAP